LSREDAVREREGKREEREVTVTASGPGRTPEVDAQTGEAVRDDPNVMQMSSRMG
jgi:hypothetical protein